MEEESGVFLSHLSPSQPPFSLSLLRQPDCGCLAFTQLVKSDSIRRAENSADAEANGRSRDPEEEEEGAETLLLQVDMRIQLSHGSAGACGASGEEANKTHTHRVRPQRWRLEDLRVPPATGPQVMRMFPGWWSRPCWCPCERNAAASLLAC